MALQIFVNLPVRDLQKSIDFYEGLGWKKNPQFSDETAACMIMSDTIYVMLLTHAKFQQFTPRTIADAFQNTEVINAISVDSKDAVNNTAEKALLLGASEVRDPQDYGFMFSRSLGDPDGH